MTDQTPVNPIRIALMAAWDNISHQTRRAVMDVASVEDVARGESVTAGVNSRMCMTVKGNLRLFYRRPHREPADTLAWLVGPGDFFSVGLSPIGGRETLAEAITASRIISLDSDQAGLLALQYPDFNQVTLLTLVLTTEALSRRVESLLTGDATARVAWALQDMLSRFHKEDSEGMLLAYRVTQSDLAQLCGVTRETVNKTIADFATNGWVSMRGHSIVLHDLDALRRLAG